MSSIDPHYFDGKEQMFEVFGPKHALAGSNNIFQRYAAPTEYGVGVPCKTISGCSAILPAVTFLAGSKERNEMAARAYYILRVRKRLSHDRAYSLVYDNYPIDDIAD